MRIFRVVATIHLKDFKTNCLHIDLNIEQSSKIILIGQE